MAHWEANGALPSTVRNYKRGSVLTWGPRKRSLGSWAVPVGGVYPEYYVTVRPVSLGVVVCVVPSVHMYVYGRVGRANGPCVPGGGALCVVSSSPPL